MAKFSIRELDTSSENDVKSYERALYRAFHAHPPGTFDNLWVFDHTNQLARTLVSYGGQRILIAEADGELIGAVALNLDMNSQLQIEKYGFSVPKEQGKTAEGLAIFSSKVVVGRNFVLPRLLENLGIFLRSQAISILWVSCEKKHLLGYQKLGFRNVTKVSFNGQDEFLLQLTIPALGAGSEVAMRHDLSESNPRS